MAKLIPSKERWFSFYIIEKNYEMIARLVAICNKMGVSTRSVVYTYSSSNKKAAAVLMWMRNPVAKSAVRKDFKQVLFRATRHYANNVGAMPKPNNTIPKRTRIFFAKCELIKRVRKVKDRLQLRYGVVNAMMIPCAVVIKKEKNRRAILTRIFRGNIKLSDEYVIECMETYADQIEKQQALYGIKKEDND